MQIAAAAVQQKKVLCWGYGEALRGRWVGGEIEIGRRRADDGVGVDVLMRFPMP